MTPKRKVAILFGGRSVEHQISILSAKNVFQHIDTSLFDVVLWGIDKLGKWYLMSEVNDDFSSGSPVSLLLDASSPAVINTETNDKITVDIVFPVLHGTDGEDGSIQGLLKAMNIPFAGSGVLGSSVAIDKLVSKRLLEAAGIPVCKFVAYDVTERKSITFEKVVNKLGLPFMAKPVNLGSSVGITKVNNKEQFEGALDSTFEYDTTILFEEYIAGRELECAVLGNKEARASHPGEIVISDRYEFYSYEAKYEDETAVDIQIPAKINAAAAAKIQSLCVQSFKTLQCEDFARVDLFLTDKDEIYINEINTIPGFTDVSMFPSLWAQHSITYPQLLTQIIELALERDADSKNINRAYNVKYF